MVLYFLKYLPCCESTGVSGAPPIYVALRMIANRGGETRVERILVLATGNHFELSR